MNNIEFKKYIKSFGFEYAVSLNNIERYEYKHYIIDLNLDHYDFYNGLNWWWYKDYNDLTDLETIFKKELRSVKLKELLR